MTNKNTLDTKVERIRQEYKNGVPARKLAKQHGVSEQSIRNAVNGRTYKNKDGVISRRHAPVTDVELNEMRERLAAGQSLNDIAAQMGRPYATVYYWLVLKKDDGEE